jgi:hypothetical protein
MRRGDELASTDMEVAQNYPSKFCEKGVISSKFNVEANAFMHISSEDCLRSPEKCLEDQSH